MWNALSSNVKEHQFRCVKDRVSKIYYGCILPLNNMQNIFNCQSVLKVDYAPVCALRSPVYYIVGSCASQVLDL